MLIRRVLLTSVVLLAGSALSLTACGGGQTPPPAEPEPAAEPSEPVVAASSEKVKAGRDAIQAGDFAKAEEILAGAAAEAPKDAQAAFYHGVALEGLEKLPEAEAEYRRAIDLSPEVLEARQNLSYLLITLERPDEAEAVAKAGLELDPKNVPLLANLAAALDLSNKPEAVGAYQKLLELAPDDAANRFNYAVLLASNEKLAEAKAELGKIRSQDAALLIDVGDLLGKLEDFAGCVARLDEAEKIEKSAKVLVYRARCKFAQKDAKGAEADLRAAVALAPEDPMPYLYLGKHLMTAGKKAEGKRTLEKAVQLGPETPFGVAAKKALTEK